MVTINTSNQQQKKFKVGDAVITSRGRIGMVSSFPTRYVIVQFGAGGPTARYLPQYLRHALKKEVVAAGMYGTGFNIIDDN